MFSGLHPDGFLEISGWVVTKSFNPLSTFRFEQYGQPFPPIARTATVAFHI